MKWRITGCFGLHLILLPKRESLFWWRNNFSWAEWIYGVAAGRTIQTKFCVISGFRLASRRRIQPYFDGDICTHFNFKTELIAGKFYRLEFNSVNLGGIKISHYESTIRINKGFFRLLSRARRSDCSLLDALPFGPLAHWLATQLVHSIPFHSRVRLLHCLPSIKLGLWRALHYRVILLTETRCRATARIAFARRPKTSLTVFELTRASRLAGNPSFSNRPIGDPHPLPLLNRTIWQVVRNKLTRISSLKSVLLWWTMLRSEFGLWPAIATAATAIVHHFPFNPS